MPHPQSLRHPTSWENEMLIMHFYDITNHWMGPPGLPRKRVRNWFGNSFFFFRIFFFFWLGVVLGLSRLLFGKTQGWKAGSCGFFRTFGGGFRAVQAPFWGNQWWNAGSIQVWTQKTASKSKLSGSFLFSVCIYLCWCVCVFVIEYVVCVFFLLLFWFFIQCTSFLVFAIYLFNV